MRRSVHLPLINIHTSFLIGILPRSGKNIQFEELTKATQQTYNFAQTFCTFVPKYAADMLDRCPLSATFDLADLDVHNGIEHDGSLVYMSLGSLCVA